MDLPKPDYKKIKVKRVPPRPSLPPRPRPFTPRPRPAETPVNPLYDDDWRGLLYRMLGLG